MPQPQPSTSMPVPSPAPYGTQHPTATRSSTQMNPGFVNPQKKKQNAVYITIQDGTGVVGVATSIKEYLNSADEYVICDSKGLPIADTSETKDLDFWKIASRKFYAIKGEDLGKLNRPDQANKKRRTEGPEITVVERLHDMEENLKMEIRSSQSTNHSDVKQSITEVIQLLSQSWLAIQTVFTEGCGKGKAPSIVDVLRSQYICWREKVLGNWDSPQVV
ncbi:hypothetical protein SKAU_G00132120 [Synaphobranchus kaupii]|uniref:Uncharacterized protein n=1 Tax=Synaphobranchus kaupii TaxID=118154 RepID=A0A9Q1FR56_SYNKA|nr:hypothetical protein SKAU_G00132120 [Synaphobranchus kaupii]